MYHISTPSRNTVTLLLSLVIFWMIFLLSQTNIFYGLDKRIQDLYYQYTSTTQTASPQIVVIEIDEDTLIGRKTQENILIEPGLGRFPFNRSYYATVIENVMNDGAAVIGLDVIFADESNIVSDRILANAINAHDNIVLWVFYSDDRIHPPIPQITNYLGGYLTPDVDRISNTTYSIFPTYTFDPGDVYEHFSILVAKTYYNFLYQREEQNVEPIYDHYNYKISDGVLLPFSSPGSQKLLINYVERSKYDWISFLDVYNGSFPEDYFQDKVVFIWATAKGLKDIFFTPTGTQPWVYSHVNMVNTILTHSPLHYLNVYIEWIMIFLLIFLSTYYNVSRSSTLLFITNICVIGVFILFIVLNLNAHILVQRPAEFLLWMMFSLVVSNIVKFFIANQHKQKLNQALSEYVSTDVAQEIISGDGTVNLNGEEKVTTILFSDIKWFTTLSENMWPQELVSFLREYLSAMSHIILDNKGFINKYEWDAIMALWGVFWDDSDTLYMACESALLQQEKLLSLNEHWKENIKIRIWIHEWTAIVGNIGAIGRKMEFTALGDHVNLASRLEWVNKFYGTHICVSHTVYNQVKSDFEFRYLDTIQVKWKNKPVKIYELLCRKWDLNGEQKKMYRQFEQAIGKYKKKDFAWAREIFLMLKKVWDAPSCTYADRCRLYARKKLPEDWDGVWKMDEK